VKPKDDNELFNAGLISSDPRFQTHPVEIVDEEDSKEGAVGDIATYRPFPVSGLPEPLSTYVRDVTASLGCDAAYVALPALVALASALGNVRRIRLKATWTEPSVFWAAVIGNSGTLKSPALELAFAPLERLMALARKRYAEELKSYEVERARFEKSQKRNSRTPSEETPPTPPILTRYFCSDITVETLASYLHDAPRGLALKRDELSGWLKGFNQYRSGRGADASHFLEMHGARALHVDRKSSGQSLYVPHAALSIVGGIQPEVLKDCLGREHVENGLAARLLMAMPPPLAKQWNDSEVSSETLRRYADLFEALFGLDFAVGQDGEKVPTDLPLTADAKALWIAFYNEIAINQAETSGPLSAAFSKLEGYAARFALLIHAIRQVANDPTLERTDAVDAHSIHVGVELAKWFVNEIERIYSLLSISRGCVSVQAPQSEETLLLYRIRGLGGTISVRQLMQKSTMYRRSAKRAKAALQLLVDGGLGRWVEMAGTRGRPTQMFELAEASRNGSNSNENHPRRADDLP